MVVFIKASQTIPLDFACKRYIFSASKNFAMELDIEKVLFDIPENVEFPLELCHHLRTKLNSVMGHNCLLKQHIAYLDKEVLELRKLKLEQQNQEMRATVSDADQPQSLMASKIVELSKKNRDMTAHFESMKTKLKKVINENEQLRSQSSETHEKDLFDDVTISDSTLPVALTNNTNIEGELLSSSTQLSQTTAKMMEYRRQCQQLKLELKTALRALSQEVGDSATPQSILCSVNNPTWRGRQQQILNLQQKLTDVQMRLLSKVENCQGSGDGPGMSGDISVSEVSHRSCSSNYGSFTPSHRTVLVQQDVKKHEQIRKLTAEMEQLSEDLKNRQQDLKASKARIQTLECQSKSYRTQMDLLEAKFQEKDFETKSLWEEMNRLKQELMMVKDREKRYRDQGQLDVQEGSRALLRERAIVGRLQQVINEKQEAIQKADIKIIDLRNKLELCCSSKLGGLHAIERLQELELQLRQYSQLLTSNEKEQERLIDLVDKSALENDHEHHKVVQAQMESAQIFVVLQQANKCIDDCLDAANVTDTSLLQEVENIRTMIRELKTGELYSLNNDTTGGLSTKKLKTRVDLLNKELGIFKTNFKELSEEHKKEMTRHARVYKELKQELGATFLPPTNNKEFKQ